MYNRYIRTDTGEYTRVSIDDTPHTSPFMAPPQHAPSHTAVPQEATKKETKISPHPTLSQRPAESRTANQILQHLQLGDIDSGDLLLLAVLFLLFYQKADDEVLIALGLLLIL